MFWLQCAPHDEPDLGLNKSTIFSLSRENWPSDLSTSSGSFKAGRFKISTDATCLKKSVRQLHVLVLQPLLSKACPEHSVFSGVNRCAAHREEPWLLPQEAATLLQPNLHRPTSRLSRSHGGSTQRPAACHSRTNAIIISSKVRAKKLPKVHIPTSFPVHRLLACFPKIGKMCHS